MHVPVCVVCLWLLGWKWPNRRYRDDNDRCCRSGSDRGSLAGSDFGFLVSDCLLFYGRERLFLTERVTKIMRGRDCDSVREW